MLVLKFYCVLSVNLFFFNDVVVEVMMFVYFLGFGIVFELVVSFDSFEGYCMFYYVISG